MGVGVCGHLVGGGGNGNAGGGGHGCDDDRFGNFLVGFGSVAW